MDFDLAVSDRTIYLSLGEDTLSGGMRERRIEAWASMSTDGAAPCTVAPPEGGQQVWERRDGCRAVSREH